MRKGVGIGLLLLLVVVLGIAIIDAGAKRPVNWSKTYNFKDKQPFGMYVFREELGNILGKERKLSTFGETIYELLDSVKVVEPSNIAIVEISDYIYVDELDVEKLLDFTHKGGEVFIASQDIGSDLLDSLGLKIATLKYSVFYPSDENISYSLGTDTTQIKIKKVEDFVVFSKLNPKNTTILGNIHSKDKSIPNFVKVSNGKGFFYFHTLPEVFCNYHMLQETTYGYASKVLNVVKSKEILLSDYYYESEEPTTPLRVILSKPGFMQAWYLLLFALVMLLLFKSKREQRAVKVILPEPNLSKEFAKTIATVYYENGDPGNIVLKKIEYFLFAIRQAYQLETMDLLDDRFIFQLSAKSTVSKEETASLMKLLHDSKERTHFSIDDVKRINIKIEEFKSKANL